MLARKFWATLSWRSSFAGDNSLVVICVHESLGTIARHVRFCSAPVYCSGRSLRSRPLCLREWRSCGHAVTSASGQTAKTASYPFLHRSVSTMRDWSYLPARKEQLLAPPNRPRLAENKRSGSALRSQCRRGDDVVAGPPEQQRHDGAV